MSVSTAPPASGAGIRRLGDGVKAVSGFAAVVVCWEFLRAGGVLPASAAPSSAAIVRALAEELADDVLLGAVGTTLAAWGVGLGVAVTIAVPAGILIGLSKVAADSTRVVFDFMRPTPSVALVPVAILIGGFGLTMKLILIVFATFWPLLFNTRSGVTEVDPLHVDTARVCGLSRAAVIRRVVLPSALPAIATGLRIAATIALALTLIAEITGSGDGLGFFILSSGQGGSYERMYVGILVASVLGTALALGLATLERRVLHWSAAHRSG